ncbi:MAG: HAMP domain-containing histidine kinase [Defluviitaleaceae bacterium]|nr:HAMP domain-containing histidine kinase [Defluviitaleaceae bacterium]MCL2239201.1 HAMP domain-containing histidine kinase [Defluviitaleaceae bacterium]MCL2240310.1 HAMP domain-containing histidine kinase [Defluviitaleaceae bacterium]
MRSFKLILIRNFIGMLFVILSIVLLLFNVLTNNFISAEANRELSRSIVNIETFADNMMMNLPFGRGRQPSIVIMENVLLQIRQMGSLRQLMMNTDGIIISEFNEIVSPNIHQMEDELASEIIFLANYFIGNRSSFEDAAMVRLAGTNNTYYLAAVKYMIPGEIYFSVLLYTDITSAMMFMRNINQTLGILLFASGIISVLLAVLISTTVQRAIMRLCNYAEIIGQGNFNEKVDGFNYKEFNMLAQSMNNMSNMLNTYESNQKQFFQNVSHEMRTPLMSIQGYAEGILADVLDKNEASQIILVESSRMEGLVAQLLYLSRLDSGMDALNISSFDLKNTLYDSAERIKILGNKSGKELELDFPPGEMNLQSDEEKLQRAIDNIMSNCIRHAKTRVKVSYLSLDERVKITIEDDGSGILQDDLPHIFERFYKGANGNSGLGLAICKDVIKKVDGSIMAENIYDDISSVAPTGARFIITAPITLSSK